MRSPADHVLTLGAPRTWAFVAYLYAFLTAAGLGYALLDLPIQVSDGYSNLAALIDRPLLRGTYNEFVSTSYLRPFIFAQHRALFTIADGHYFEWFRGWHVLQVFVLVVVFVHLLRPRTLVDAAVVPLGLATLIGLHTFAGTVREAFPINTFMTILVCSLLAADLAIAERSSIVRDVCAILLFVFAALTVESGLLLWVILVTLYLAGARGVSRRGIVAVTALLAAYFCLRFGVLKIGGPGLMERSSGFGFSLREPRELIELFGANPLPFYLYNVVTSAISVLLSEPRAGIWRFVKASIDGQTPPSMLVNVVASALGTTVIACYVWRRRREWRARQWDSSDRMVILFITVLMANAVISYPYTKDVIMSPAGMFYALALAVAARDLLIRVPHTAVVRFAASIAIGLLSVTWALRSTGTHLSIGYSAFQFRNEWAYIDQWNARERRTISDPVVVRLQSQLHDDAIVNHPGVPLPSGRWLERWFELE